jgi:hypothetical protein
MLHFKRCLWLALTFLMVAVLCQPAIAYEDTEKKDGPWETAAIMGGAFFANVDSSLDLGTSGVQGSVDGEDALGLNENPIVWRIDAFYRITKRNRIDFMYYDFSRKGDKFIGVQIDDPNNGTIPIGTEVKTKFDFRLGKVTWAYAFFKDERMEIFGGLGAYILSVDFKMQAEGIGKVEDTTFTYPLPAVRLGASFAITDTVMLRQNVDFFYLAYKDFTGNIVDLGVNLDWNFWKYAGIGIGYNFMWMQASQNKDDFLSEVDMSYGGLLLYGKIYF